MLLSCAAKCRRRTPPTASPSVGCSGYAPVAKEGQGGKGEVMESPPAAGGGGGGAAAASSLFPDVVLREDRKGEKKREYPGGGTEEEVEVDDAAATEADDERGRTSLFSCGGGGRAGLVFSSSSSSSGSVSWPSLPAIDSAYNSAMISGSSSGMTEIFRGGYGIYTGPWEGRMVTLLFRGVLVFFVFVVVPSSFSSFFIVFFSAIRILRLRFSPGGGGGDRK